MKLLYLAGPFSAPAGDPDPLHTVEANIHAASRVALEAARAGWMPVCPHKNSAGFQHCPDLSQEFWYEGDIALMKRCDAVLMLPGYERSKGALGELEAARADGMAVHFYAEFDEVPAPYESHWSAPLERLTTPALVLELWHRSGVSPVLLGDDDTILLREDGGGDHDLSRHVDQPAIALIIGAAAYAPREGTA